LRRRQTRRVHGRAQGRFTARSWLNDRGISASDLSDLDDSPAGESDRVVFWSRDADGKLYEQNTKE
jgi:hypothetical protein